MDDREPGSAWSTAQIGVQPTGLRPYFMNSIMMAVPAVLLSTVVGALNGYVLTKWRFRGDTLIFGLLLFSCFIPFQIVLIPMARMLGIIQLAGTTPGLILVHFVYGIGFTTLYFRNYYAAFPTELVRARRSTGRGSSRSSGGSCCRPRGRSSRSVFIWQFTNIWNDFLFGASFASGFRAADDGGAQQPRQLLHGRARIQRALRRRDHGGRCRRSSSTSSRAATSCAASWRGA
jgi:glucose/mannose transport system permease protein